MLWATARPKYLIADTGSLDETYVNRKPAESVALANGDEIQMGKFRLVFRTRPTTHWHPLCQPARKHPASGTAQARRETLGRLFRARRRAGGAAKVAARQRLS